mgnify:CR=1 FL=1
MKIIAQAKEHYYLVEAHENELANLLEFYWSGQKDCPKFEIGTEIKVSDIYKAIYNLACKIDKTSEGSLCRISENLRNLANSLDIIDNRFSNGEESMKSIVGGFKK